MSTSQRILDLEDTAWQEHSDCIRELRQGVWTAVVLRGLYSTSEMETITERLDQIDATNVSPQNWTSMRFPESFRGWFLGENLNLLEDSLFDYFDREPMFSSNMQNLFTDIPGGTEQIFERLSKLDQGRRYLAAPGPDINTKYQFTTLRGHAQGGYIPIHCDNEQAWRPSYEHLLSQIQENLFSFVLMIGKPEGGGNLRIYNHRIPVGQRSTIDQARYAKTDQSFMNDYVEIDLKAGDLVLADSGSHPHEVTKVIGTKTRWTMCSFMAEAKGKHAVYCWG